MTPAAQATSVIDAARRDRAGEDGFLEFDFQIPEELSAGDTTFKVHGQRERRT